jgi:hypothetical protein
MSKIIITIEIPDGAAVGVNTTSAPSRATSEPTSHATAPAADSQADPWGSSDNSSAVKPEPSNVKVVQTKNGDQTWTFHAPNAPTCHCDIVAAHVEGKKRDSDKTWKAWRCAKGAGDNWKDKCDFSEWA